MNQQESKISGMHVMFAIACVLQGSSFLTAFFTNITTRDSWIIVIAGFLASLLFSLPYVALVGRFPGKTLVQMHEAVYGRAAGKIISAFYIFFFLSLCALNSKDLGSFIGNELLSETPIEVIISVFLFFCAWAVRKGALNLLRYSVLFCALTSAAVLSSNLLLIPDFELGRFFPVLTLPSVKYIQAVHIIVGIPYLEIVAFLMIFPVIRKQEDIKKVVFGGLGIGALTLFFIVVNEIGVLGNMIEQLKNPTFESLHLINVGEILTRLEVLFSFFITILLFYKVTILFYAVVLAIGQTLELERCKGLTFAIGALILVYALVVFPNAAEHAVWGNTVAAVFSSVFQIGFPLVTLAAAAIRKPEQKGGVNQA